MNLICQRVRIAPFVRPDGLHLASSQSNIIPFQLIFIIAFFTLDEYIFLHQNSAGWLKCWEKSKMFSVPSCFCFSSVGPAGPPGQIHLWLYGLHNISRKQNNHQTKHNPLLKLDLEQQRSSQIGKKGNADIWTTVCKVKDPKIPSLLFVSISKGSEKRKSVEEKIILQHVRLTNKRTRKDRASLPLKKEGWDSRWTRLKLQNFSWLKPFCNYETHLVLKTTFLRRLSRSFSSCGIFSQENQSKLWLSEL